MRQDPIDTLRKDKWIARIVAGGLFLLLAFVYFLNSFSDPRVPDIPTEALLTLLGMVVGFYFMRKQNQ